MSIKKGWQGRFFEDFEVGDIYKSRVGRTVTESDNTTFTLLTNNSNQIHFNTEYGAICNSVSDGAKIVQSILSSRLNIFHVSTLNASTPVPQLCHRNFWYKPPLRKIFVIILSCN